MNKLGVAGLEALVERLAARIEALEARLAKKRLSDGDIARIVDAVMQTDELSWVHAKMDVEKAQDSYLFGGGPVQGMPLEEP